MNPQPLDLTAAQTALAEHKAAFEVFAQLLIEHNRTMNLTRIDTPHDIQNRHFLDSLAALPVLAGAASGRQTVSVLDIGSGAGFPGVAIAMARPQWHVVSLEATEKKARFQQHLCCALGLANVSVLHGRAEVLAHRPDLREQYDAVTARAVAGLDVLAELTMAFARPGGLGIFWKGPMVQEEIAAARPAFEQMGAQPSALYAYRLPQTPSEIYLAAFQKQHPTPVNRPRKNFAAVKKRPLK